MKKKFLLSMAIFCAGFVACSKKDSSTDPGSTTKLTTAQKKEMINNYADILHAGYEDSYKSAVMLQISINIFLASPDSLKYEAIKTAWKAARVPYQQTEMSRFYNGPIDGDDGDGLLNSWPLDEGYIDYLVADKHATTAYSTPNYNMGIINLVSKYPTISSDFLVSNNQPDGGSESPNGDNEAVSCGYHAIEFLIWGQDDTAPEAALVGRRSWRDYITGINASAPNADRRIIYLNATMSLLLDNLKEMADAWDASQAGNYRSTFTSDAKIDASIANIFLGMGSLAKGELSGERLFVPLSLHSQEQEHSCFSDNTSEDLYYDMVGIQNAYLGTYTRIDGSQVKGLGLSDYINGLKSDDNTKMTSLVSAGVSSMKSIKDAYSQNQHFDYLIAGNNSAGNKIIQNAIDAVGAVADYINQMSKDLSLNVTVPDENP